MFLKQIKVENYRLLNKVTIVLPINDNFMEYLNRVFGQENIYDYESFLSL